MMDIIEQPLQMMIQQILVNFVQLLKVLQLESIPRENQFQYQIYLNLDILVKILIVKQNSVMMDIIILMEEQLVMIRVLLVKGKLVVTQPIVDKTVLIQMDLELNLNVSKLNPDIMQMNLLDKSISVYMQLIHQMIIIFRD